MLSPWNLSECTTVKGTLFIVGEKLVQEGQGEDWGRKGDIGSQYVLLLLGSSPTHPELPPGSAHSPCQSSPTLPLNDFYLLQWGIWEPVACTQESQPFALAASVHVLSEQLLCHWSGAYGNGLYRTGSNQIRNRKSLHSSLMKTS